MASPANAVDDAKGYVRPLVKQLQRHVDRLAKDIPHRSAGAWVYLSAVLAWAEDHALVDVWLRKGLDGIPGRSAAPPSMVVRLAQAFAGLTAHPATQWLLHPAYNPDLHAATPAEAAVAELAQWWANDAPSLAYDVEDGPESISGWIVGDLLQLVTDERRKAYALAQTPWWVADGILDLTLLPACAEFADQPLIQTIDPTAGTGHFLVRTMDYLWEWYTTGALSPRQMHTQPVGGGTPVPAAVALPRVIASVDGVELDPLTAAVARLRCTVYAAHLARRGGLAASQARLDRIPRALVPRVGVGDSLLLGEITEQEYRQLHPALADLPAASFTLGDWDWPAAAPADLPAAAPAAEQLDLFAEVA